MELTTTMTIPSSRVYLDTVDKGQWKSILNTFLGFNAMKEWAYNRMYDATFLGKEFEAAQGIRAELDRSYGTGVPGYYVTSIFSTASGMVKSQKELVRMYEEENGLRVKHILDSIGKDKKQLGHYQKVKDGIIKYSKRLKSGAKRLPKVKTYHDTCPDLCPVRNEDGTYDKKKLHSYELHVDAMVHTLKTRIAQKGHRAFRKSEKDFHVPRRVTFGGRDFYKTKDTKSMDATELSAWHNERAFRRIKTIHISGRHDSPHGNFCCRYCPEDETITLRCWDGTDAVFRGVKFPYKGEAIVKNLALSKKEGRRSIGYTLELHIDKHDKAYIIFKATLDVTYTHLNDCTGDGVISIDMNYDNISVANLNRDGCRIGGFVIRFDLLSGDTNRNKDTLGRVCTEIAALCRETHKPLGMEDIDTQAAKTKMAYGSKKGNAHASVFAYQTMTAFLTGKCASMGVGTIKVDPAYTSQASKMKYMRSMNSSIHEGAAVTVGRRAMGISEKVPKYLRHLVPNMKRTEAWRVLTWKMKRVPTVVFYSKHTDNRPIEYYKEFVYAM